MVADLHNGIRGETGNLKSICNLKSAFCNA